MCERLLPKGPRDSRVMNKSFFWKKIICILLKKYLFSLFKDSLYLDESGQDSRIIEHLVIDDSVNEEEDVQIGAEVTDDEDEEESMSRSLSKSDDEEKRVVKKKNVTEDDEEEGMSK